VSTIRTALIQFDARPEAAVANVDRMCELIAAAAQLGARWVMFHEGTVSDYTPRLDELAEPVPDGPSTQRVVAAAAAHQCCVSFGLSESAAGRTFIAQVFVEPDGSVYCYRKTWLWREPADDGFRNEWSRYDPGTGPEAFDFDGVRATCFICADGEAPRCIERAARLQPQVAFFPNNRGQLPDFGVFGERAREIGAPMLVTNRIGKSWTQSCVGGCVVYSATGDVLAAANREGREEILIHDLALA
jgi:predicted amidohydrolase